MPCGGVGGTREVPQEWELGFGVALHPAMPSLLLLLSRSRWAWVEQGWSCWKRQPGARAAGADTGIQLRGMSEARDPHSRGNCFPGSRRGPAVIKQPAQLFNRFPDELPAGITGVSSRGGWAGRDTVLAAAGQ